MFRYRHLAILTSATLLSGFAAAQEPTLDPFPTPIETREGVIAVNYVEFATIPDVGGQAPRLMHFVDEPGTKRTVRQRDDRAALQHELRRQGR